MHPSRSLALSTPQSNISRGLDPSSEFNIQVKEFKITNLRDLDKLSPYIQLDIGKRTYKSKVSRIGDNSKILFNEVFTISKTSDNLLKIMLYHKTHIFHKDKLLGEGKMDINQPHITSLFQIELTDGSEDIIGSLSIKTLNDHAPEVVRRRLHTEHAPLVFQTNHSNSNLSLDLSENTVKRINSAAIVAGLRKTPTLSTKYSNFSNYQSTDVTSSILKHSKNAFMNFSNLESMDIQNNKLSKDFVHKVGLADFENTCERQSLNNILQLEDAEKLKFELNEEKSRINTQAVHLSKMLRKLQKKQTSLDQQKSAVQKNKEKLAQEELELLEEKKKWEAQINLFNKEKESYTEQKAAIMSEIESIQQNSVLVKNKNQILEQKIKLMTQQLQKIANRREYFLSQSEEPFECPIKRNSHFNNTTMTFYGGKQNTDTDRSELSHNNSGCRIQNALNITSYFHPTDSIAEEYRTDSEKKLFIQNVQVGKRKLFDSECEWNIKEDESRQGINTRNFVHELQKDRFFGTDLTPALSNKFHHLQNTEVKSISLNKNSSFERYNTALKENSSSNPSFCSSRVCFPNTASPVCRFRLQASSIINYSIVSEVSQENAVSYRMMSNKQYIYCASLEGKK